MELDETYKYLDTEEGNCIDDSQMKDKLVKDITFRCGKFSRLS